MKVNKKSLSYKTASMGIMGALAIVLGYLESLIPPVPFMPPGAKLGISNIVVMFAAKKFGLAYALVIALIKAGFAGITRGFVAFCMSLAGGILSAVVTYLIINSEKKPFGCIGLGILSAAAHNVGQLIVALVLLGNKAVFAYAPYLFLFSLITGALTGTVLKIILPAIERLEETKI